MDQFITSTDLAGITPEIILTLTAICVLSLEMMRFSKPSFSLLIAVLGLGVAGIVIFQGAGYAGLLFGGMLKINLFTTFFDLIYITIGLATLLFSPGYLEKKRRCVSRRIPRTDYFFCYRHDADDTCQ